MHSMESNSRYASERTETGTRLRGRPSGENSFKDSRFLSSESLGGDRSAGEFSRKGREISGDERYFPGADRPTSPAFMRLLSQRSPKSPSQTSRSPSVLSQLSSRRRVSSPTIAARAWMTPAPDLPPATPPLSRKISADNTMASQVSTVDEPQEFSALNRYRGRPSRTEGRDEHNDSRGRSNSRHSRKGHRKRRDSKKRTEDGARLRPLEGSPRTPSYSSAKPAPRLVMSPRRLPPPTFEKILLGLADSDFTLDNDDPDVFNSRDSLTRPEIVVDQEEEECVSDSVEPDDPHGDHLSSSTLSASRASQESSLGDGTDSQRDAVIPEHYLYIPPLRLGTSTEDRRPVPALHPPSHDDGQVSVRGERRHIATLFSLEAAESHAQKAHLQEQLKATSPFRLAEMGDASSAVGEDFEGPPGKTKRRQRSKVLETIVRQHDWKPQELAIEEETQISQRPHTPLDSSSRAGDDVPASDDGQWEQLIERVKLPVTSGDVSAEEEHDRDYAGEDQEEGSVVSEDAETADVSAPAQSRTKEGSVGDEAADVPGSFDAIWGGYEGSQQARNDSASEATHSDNEGIKHDIFGVNSGPRRITDLLEGPSVLSEGEEEEDLPPHPTGLAGDASEPPLGAGTGSQRAPPPQSLAPDGKVGGVALLQLGDPAEWEVRYSTADGFPSSTEQSPAHCVEALSPVAPAEEDSAGEDEEEVRVDVVEEEVMEISGGEALEHAPEKPPSTASCHRDISAGQWTMHSYSNSRLSSAGHYDATSHPAASLANALPVGGALVTTEPSLGAALDLRRVSLQPGKSDGAESRRPIISRRSLASAPSGRRSASRKRQRTLQDEDLAAAWAIRPPPRSRLAHGDSTKKKGKSACDRIPRPLAGNPASSSSPERLKERVQEEEPQRNVVVEAEAAVGVAARQRENCAPLPNPGPPTRSAINRLQLAEARCEPDAWEEGASISLRDVEANHTDGHQTDRRGSECLCEIDLSEPPRSSGGMPPFRSPPPSPSLPLEVFQAISRATGGRIYGPGVHAIFVGSMLLAVWALLAVFYLFDDTRGVRFFVVCSMALSFVISLCLGFIQLTASLFRWKALKYAIDFDMREVLFSSLQRLRPAPDALDPSIEGMGERGRQLRLACAYFVELITQGSPCLELSRVVERRFIMVNCAVGMVGLGLIVVLECTLQSAGRKPLIQLHAGDALATGAAVLYSVLLLAVSYWLATCPSPAAVQRAVEKHANFQHLWVLTLADFLVDKGAVTAKSAEDIRLHNIEGLPSQSLPNLRSLNNLLFKRNKSMATVCIDAVARSVKTNCMTARIVWRLPSETSPKILKGFRVGQRALLTLTTAPCLTHGPDESSVPLFLKLTWCGSSEFLEELQIPIGFDSLEYESIVFGRMPSRLRSFLCGQLGPDAGNAVATQAPLEVIRHVLGLLQGYSAHSFLKSQMRRHLDKPVPLSSAALEFPLVLRIPVDAIAPRSCSACGLRQKGKKSVAASCYKLEQSQRQELTVGLTDVEAAFASHKGIAKPKDPEGGIIRAKVGPWTVQSPCAAVAQPLPAMQPRSGTNKRLDVSPHASGAASEISRAYSNAAGSEGFALLTLLFASDEQRAEFSGRLKEVLCA